MQTRERETWTWDDYYAHVQQKSFARLTDEALDELCNIGSIVDMGAGNGYWTSELHNRGVDIVAVEPNRMANPVFPRREADHWCITDYPNRALLMIWPTRQAAWPQQCVQEYKGNTVAYVGDSWFLETGSIWLRQALIDGGFERTRRVKVNSWPGYFTDVLQIWRRD
jgi:hypothetical protein